MKGRETVKTLSANFCLPISYPILGFLIACVLTVFSTYGFANDMAKILQSSADRLSDGSTFVLPTSHCMIDKTIVFENKANITIDGRHLAVSTTSTENSGSTIIQLMRNTVTMKFINCNNITVKNLNLVGEPKSFNPASETLGIGIYMKNCAGKHLFENLKFYDHGFTGFYAHDVSNITFRQCLFNAENVRVTGNDNYNCGIYSYGNLNKNWEIMDCAFEKTGSGLILYSNHDYVKIHENVFTDIRGQHGVYLNASSYVDIRKNFFKNIFGVAIKLQMNEGWKQTKKNIAIIDNVCDIEKDRDRAQAGIFVGIGRGRPAKGIYWENVLISNNRVNHSNYGVELNYVKDANIVGNQFSDSVYGILCLPCCGSIRRNEIITTKWSGILCEIIDNQKIVIEDNKIQDAVHVSMGDDYKRSCVFLTGNGEITFKNNQLIKDRGQHLYGLFLGPGISLISENNLLLSPIKSKGKIISQVNNQLK